MTATMRVHILALDGLFDSGFTSFLDIMTEANALAPAGLRPFDFSTVGVKQAVTTRQGMRLTPGAALGEAPRPHVLILPALAVRTAADLEAMQRRADVRRAVELIAALYQRGTRILAACTGVALAGLAGVLEGRRVTTSWWFATVLRQQFPRAQVDEDSMVVQDGGLMTAGAALAHVDLALALLRGHSPELAATTARYVLVDERASQAPYIMPHQLAQADPIVEQFERHVRSTLPESFSLTDAARAVGVSPRIFGRRVQQVLGKGPLAFVQAVRVETAVHLLRTSNANLDEIAERVGYNDGVTLSTLLRRKLGVGVKALRR